MDNQVTPQKERQALTWSFTVAGEEGKLLKEILQDSASLPFLIHFIAYVDFSVKACGLHMQYYRANLEWQAAFSKWWLWANIWQNFSEWFMLLVDGEMLHQENKNSRIMSLALSLTKINWWYCAFIIMKGLSKDTVNQKKQWSICSFIFMCLYHRDWIIKSTEASFIYVVWKYSPC